MLWSLFFALLSVAYGASAVKGTGAFVSVDLIVQSMNLVLAPFL
jgi:hypothetical protein